MACLYFLQSLVKKYGKDETVTTCLDTRAFYIVPRVNPDGAEWALADIPRFIRSSTRPYPYDEEPVEGLLEEDIDGDGRILTMRIPDPNGAWKAHPDDPRLMIRRDPVERGGSYYRLLPEGSLRNYDGTTIQAKPPSEGLDLNRNFPVGWRQENEQLGAGPYPTSEPESRNLVDFIVRHPNLTGVVTFHTYSGVILRPYDDRADDEMPAEDLWTYKKIGEKGTQLTGYPNLSCYHDFRYHPKKITTGGFDTWMYDHRGMFGWTMEIWSPMRQAGIKDYKYIDWFREHPLEDDLKLMKWNDEALGGEGYVDWYAFQHPQLGQGGAGRLELLRLLDQPAAEIPGKGAGALPGVDYLAPAHLAPAGTARGKGGSRRQGRLAGAPGGGEHRLAASYVTKKAVEKKVTRGVIGEIELPEGATLRTGKLRQEFAELEGRAYKSAFADGMEGSTDERLKMEWVVSAPQGGTVKLTARHDRAGVVRVELPLQ